ncbi:MULTISPECIES: hypothetical protein [unclassified Neisseria]|nr:hypothetical protein HMPREF3156_00795 [Neisseria sp. HMSC06F02]
MKKSFFALMLAAVLPTANAASVAELEERIEVLEARVASLERIILSGSRNANCIYVCSIKPFQKLFEASGKNEWEARLAVRRACNAETSAMFCEDSAIRCEKYE